MEKLSKAETQKAYKELLSNAIAQNYPYRCISIYLEVMRKLNNVREQKIP